MLRRSVRLANKSLTKGVPALSSGTSSGNHYPNSGGGNNATVATGTQPENEPAICRICYCHDIPNDELIQPCACKGNTGYIHRRCLGQWLSGPARPFACEICKTPFFVHLLTPYSTFRVYCTRIALCIRKITPILLVNVSVLWLFNFVVTPLLHALVQFLAQCYTRYIWHRLWCWSCLPDDAALALTDQQPVRLAYYWFEILTFVIFILVTEYAANSDVPIEHTLTYYGYVGVAGSAFGVALAYCGIVSWRHVAACVLAMRECHAYWCIIRRNWTKAGGEAHYLQRHRYHIVDVPSWKGETVARLRFFHVDTGEPI